MLFLFISEWVLPCYSAVGCVESMLFVLHFLCAER